MDTSFEKKYHELEDHHPWFVARREMLLDLFRAISKDSNILDIGCSAGVMMKELIKRGFNHITGLDISQQAIDLCHEQGLQNVYVMDGADPKFPAGTFDCIIASDVLEHIKEDGVSVSNWQKLLKPNGIVICFVPAFKFLWSRHDTANQHFRRYTRASLKQVFQNNGLTVIRSSYWNFFLFFPTVIIRLIQRLLPEKQGGDNLLVVHNKVVRWLTIFLPRIEKYMLRYINFPFGISTFVIAKK